MIEQPPKLDTKLIQKVTKLSVRTDVTPLIRNINDDYLYWTEVKYKSHPAIKCLTNSSTKYWTEVKYKSHPADLSSEHIWAAAKLNRLMQQIKIWNDCPFTLSITNNMQKLCHYFDMNFGGSWENSAIIPSEDRERYLISSLMEEAISSSQMEGAATTRRVAKEMLRKSISPHNKSEQMIVNNYEGIRFIAEHKDDKMSMELLLKIHSKMTAKTLNDSTNEGKFRQNNDIVVIDGITNEIVHTPPSYKEIPDFINRICEFANNEAKDVFIHPIIKAIIIHFLLAYLHPFVDGNGRTARALFYWYMLKNGYWLTEYLSISRIIYASKRQYEKAYLYVETDDYDLGYFVTYHLKVLSLAFKKLQDYIQRKIYQRQNSINLLKLGSINERQSIILSLYRDNPKMIMTVKEVENRFSVSHTTAKSDLDGLVSQQFLKKIPINKVKFSYIKGELFDSKTRLV